MEEQQTQESTKDKVLDLIQEQILTQMQIRQDNYPLLATETRAAIAILRELRQQIETVVHYRTIERKGDRE